MHCLQRLSMTHTRNSSKYDWALSEMHTQRTHVTTQSYDWDWHLKCSRSLLSICLPIYELSNAIARTESIREKNVLRFRLYSFFIGPAVSHHHTTVQCTHWCELRTHTDTVFGASILRWHVCDAVVLMTKQYTRKRSKYSNSISFFEKK